MPEEGEVVLNLDPGACRFKTKIRCRFDGEKVKVTVETDCPHGKKMAPHLQDMSMMDIIQMPFSDNPVYIESGKYLKHSVCPIPVGILKCAEAAMGLAIKKEIKAEFEK